MDRALILKYWYKITGGLQTSKNNNNLKVYSMSVIKNQMQTSVPIAFIPFIKIETELRKQTLEIFIHLLSANIQLFWSSVLRNTKTPCRYYV